MNDFCLCCFVSSNPGELIDDHTVPHRLARLKCINCFLLILDRAIQLRDLLQVFSGWCIMLFENRDKKSNDQDQNNPGEYFDPRWKLHVMIYAVNNGIFYPLQLIVYVFKCYWHSHLV